MLKNTSWWISYYLLGCNMFPLHITVQKDHPNYRKIQVIFIQIYITVFFV